MSMTVWVLYELVFDENNIVHKKIPINEWIGNKQPSGEQVWKFRKLDKYYSIDCHTEM
jgi:hypothetical protein